MVDNTQYYCENKKADNQSLIQTTKEPLIQKFVHVSKVQYCYDRLCVHYRAALGIGFYNVVGKLFMSALGDYANMCTINRHQYSYLHSTSTGSTPDNRHLDQQHCR